MEEEESLVGVCGEGEGFEEEDWGGGWSHLLFD